MSRYTILFLLNLPFVILAFLSIITRYKLKLTSRRKTLARLVMWLVIFMGLVFAGPLYNWLFSSGYTESESLSLFDVIQITALVALFYITTRMRVKLDTLEQRVAGLHREISIRLSGKL